MATHAVEVVYSPLVKTGESVPPLAVTATLPNGMASPLNNSQLSVTQP